MQLLVLGLVGEYLGQVLKETRRRPPYLIGEAGGDGATLSTHDTDEGRARHAA
jgi:hypothetical protein